MAILEDAILGWGDQVASPMPVPLEEQRPTVNKVLGSTADYDPGVETPEDIWRIVGDPNGWSQPLTVEQYKTWSSDEIQQAYADMEARGYSVLERTTPELRAYWETLPHKKSWFSNALSSIGPYVPLAGAALTAYAGGAALSGAGAAGGTAAGTSELASMTPGLEAFYSADAALTGGLTGAGLSSAASLPLMGNLPTTGTTALGTTAAGTTLPQLATSPFNPTNAILGSAAIGGLGSYLGAEEQAGAIESAASAQESSTQAAIDAQQEMLDKSIAAQLEMYYAGLGMQEPWRYSGAQALESLQRELYGQDYMAPWGDTYRAPGPEGMESTYQHAPQVSPEMSPLYQIQLQEAQKSIDRLMASRGAFDSGAAAELTADTTRKLAATDALRQQGLMETLAGYGSGTSMAGLQASMGLGGNLASTYGNYGTNVGNALIQAGANRGNLALAGGQNTANLYTNLANLGMAGLNAYTQYQGLQSGALNPYYYGGYRA